MRQSYQQILSPNTMLTIMQKTRPSRNQPLQTKATRTKVQIQPNHATRQQARQLRTNTTTLPTTPPQSHQTMPHLRPTRTINTSQAPPNPTQKKHVATSPTKSPEPSLLRRTLNTRSHFLSQGGNGNRSQSSTVHVFLRFLQTFRDFSFSHPIIAFFNSTQVTRKRPCCRLTQAATQHLNRTNFTVVANNNPNLVRTTGHNTHRTNTPDCNYGVRLPSRRRPGPCVSRIIALRRFFIHGIVLVHCSYTFILVPKNFNALSRVLRTLILVRANGLRHFPIIDVNSTF